VPGQVRDATRTRRALLDAAARSVVTHGAGVRLDVVAREAGVSKGGLMHHFRSKDDLMAALADDLFDRFDRAVRSTSIRTTRRRAGSCATLSSFPDAARRSLAIAPLFEGPPPQDELATTHALLLRLASEAGPLVEQDPPS
jgi:AcrR family transcriptional regulator